MEEFIKIKTSIEKEIQELKNKINGIKRLQYDKKEASELVEKIKDKEEALSSKERKEISKQYPETQELFTVLGQLKKYSHELGDFNFDAVDKDTLKNILSISGVSIFDLEPLLSDYDFTKEMIGFVTDKTYDDLEVKKTVLDSLKKIIDKLHDCYKKCTKAIIKIVEEKYNEKYGTNQEEEIEKINERINFLQKINVFDDKGNITKFFEDKETLEQFYEWLKENATIETQLKVIEEITFTGLLISKEEKEEIEEIVDKNREEILQELYEDSIEERKDVIESTDLSSLDEKEKELVILGLSAYKELREKISERTELLSVDDKIEDRREYYLLGDKYNWNFILEDLEKNIFPKISENKEEALNTIQLFIELYSEEKKTIEDRKRISKILKEYIGELKQYLVLGKDFYTSEYDFIIENGLGENSEYIPKNISYEQIQFSYFLNHNLQKMIDELQSKRDEIKKKIEERVIQTQENDGIDLNVIDAQVDFISGEAEEKLDELKSKTNNGKEEYDFTENLVFCVGGNLDQNDKKYQEDFNKTFEIINNKKFWEIGHKMKKLYKKTSTGKFTEYDIPHVDMFRLRALGDSRTGIAKFDVCEKVKKMLQARYNLGDESTIYGAFNIITPGANHKPYNILGRTVNSNIEIIEMLGKMLNDEKVDKDQLFTIIDIGLRDKDSFIKKEVVPHE